jgi:hypothetical protein
MYVYMTPLFILVTLAHFHFVIVVDTVSYSGALSKAVATVNHQKSKKSLS